MVACGLRSRTGKHCAAPSTVVLQPTLLFWELGRLQVPFQHSTAQHDTSSLGLTAPSLPERVTASITGAVKREPKMWEAEALRRISEKLPREPKNLIQDRGQSQVTATVLPTRVDPRTQIGRLIPPPLHTVVSTSHLTCYDSEFTCTQDF